MGTFEVGQIVLANPNLEATKQTCGWNEEMVQYALDKVPMEILEIDFEDDEAGCANCAPQNPNDFDDEWDYYYDLRDLSPYIEKELTEDDKFLNDLL